MWEILTQDELMKIRKRLFERYGIKKVPFVIVRSGKRKYRAATKEAVKIPKAQLVGVYVMKETPFGLMLSIEGTQLFGPLARKNVFEIPDEMVDEWMRGKDIEIGVDEELEKGLVIIRSGNLYLGSGLYDGCRIKNLLPKARKVIGNY